MIIDNDQEPKCLRIVVTAFFADGSSTVIDIPEPSDVKDDSRIVYPNDVPETPYPTIMSSEYEFVLRVRVNSEIPMRRTPLPIPKQKKP